MILSRRNLPLNAMRAFEAAARHCHLRKAAEELGVTHGAVSRQVRQLEEILAIELFDRSHNRLSLTSAGQRLLPGVREGLDKIAESALYLDPDSMSGSLVIASTPSISAGWLVTAMAEFSRQHPEVELRLLNIDPLERELPAEVDVAICYGRPDVGQREIIELFQERYFPVCHPSLLQGKAPINSPEDLLRHRLLHDHHNLWPRWLNRMAVEGRAQQQMYLQDSYQVLSALREGCGIGLMDRVDVHQELCSGQLVSLFDETIEAEQRHFLVVEKESRSTVRARLFAEHLQRYLRDSVLEK
jgi:LysR family glycine cleavage system transcriptional activator